MTAELTEERLRQLRDDPKLALASEHGITEDELVAMAEAALSHVRATGQKPVATKLVSDPYDERDGSWFSAADLKRIHALPVGTSLYTTPQPAGTPAQQENEGRLAELEQQIRLRDDDRIRLQAEINARDETISELRDELAALRSQPAGTPAALNAEYCRGRDDGFDAGRLAERQKVGTPAWAVKGPDGYEAVSLDNGYINQRVALLGADKHTCTPVLIVEKK